MKLKFVTASYAFLALLMGSFVACDDNTNSLGLGLLPSQDGIEVNSTSFEISMGSELMDAVYVKTENSYVGSFESNLFGSLKGDFITQFATTREFEFPDSMVSHKIDSVYLYVWYSKFYGDSLTPMRLSIYELNKVIDVKTPRVRYTDFDPTGYFSTSDLLGRKVFSAADLNKSDSVRFDADFVPSIVVKVTNPTFGQSFVDRYFDNPTYFRDPALFSKEILKGICVKSDFGEGSLLAVNTMYLSFFYSVNKIKDNSQGKDSLVSAQRNFYATKEIITTNNIQKDEAKYAQLIAANSDPAKDQYTFIKSPSGICTKVVLPIKKIAETLNLTGDSIVDQKSINGVKLIFEALPNSAKEQMELPATLLFIRKTELTREGGFFENNRLIDNKNSYLAVKNSINEYRLENIVTLVIQGLKDYKAGLNDGNVEYVLLPVDYTTDADGAIAQISHSLTPAYAKLKGNSFKPQLSVIYTTPARK